MPTLEPTFMPPVPQNPTPPAALAPPQTSGLSVEALQAQLAGNAQQLAVLEAQRNVLRRQINVTPPGPVRDGLIAQQSTLDNQLLKLQLDVAGSRAELASRLGMPVERIGPNGRFLQQTAPDFGPRRYPDPDAIVAGSFTLAIAVALPLTIAYARRIWRGRTSASASADTVSPRLERLEQAVEAIAIEIERVAEGQRFVTRVLAERPPQAQVNGAATEPLARDASTPIAEAKPFLALGAGPIDPIRVAERQAVRQSITPH